MAAEKYRCEGVVRYRFGFYACCLKSARYEDSGKFYCKTHHPPTIVAKKYARDAIQAAREKVILAAKAWGSSLDKDGRVRDDLVAALVTLHNAEEDE